MTNKVVVERYAEAFVGYARESIGLKRIVEEFKNLKGIFRENPDFKELLQSPEITHSEKIEIVNKVLAEDFSVELKNFLQLLIEKGRINEILDIADYMRVTYAHEGKVDAVLNTTYMLDLDLVEAIKDKLESKLNKKLNLHINLDPDLLGGVQVVIGNKVIDGSVRRRLEELKEKLLLIRII